MKTYDDTAVQMALFVSRNLTTASDIEVRAACNVLVSVRGNEASEAFARCVSEAGRRLMRCETLAEVEAQIGRAF